MICRFSSTFHSSIHTKTSSPLFRSDVYTNQQYIHIHYKFLGKPYSNGTLTHIYLFSFPESWLENRKGVNLLFYSGVSPLHHLHRIHIKFYRFWSWVTWEESSVGIILMKTHRTEKWEKKDTIRRLIIWPF